MDSEDHLQTDEHSDDDFEINREIAGQEHKEVEENENKTLETASDEEEDNNDDRDYDEESDEDLEKKVFGGEDEMEEIFDDYIVTKKRKGDDIESIQKKPKWHDEDDNDKVLKDVAKPDWAKKTNVEEEDEENATSDDEEKIDWRTGNYISTSKFIPRNQLNYRRCVDINKECPTKGKIRVLEFLKKAPVAIVAGADLSLSIFQVDGKTNLKVQTILFESFPVFRAHFSADGSEILVGSQYPSILSYNMNTGKSTKFHLKGNSLVKDTKLFAVSPDGKYLALVGSFGHIHILSAKSKKCLHLLKAESETIGALAFSPNGNELFSHGDRGVVSVWCMKSFTCLFSFQDDGCVLGTSIAVSPDGELIATGSSTGVVNVYNRSALTKARSTAAKYQLPRPMPMKAIENLVSGCTALAFNHTGELLAMASNFADNALKMLHVRSLTVFANFPPTTRTVGVPYSIGFSPNSGYFACGNHNGHTHLYRLQHYTSY